MIPISDGFLEAVASVMFSTSVIIPFIAIAGVLIALAATNGVKERRLFWWPFVANVIAVTLIFSIVKESGDYIFVASFVGLFIWAFVELVRGSSLAVVPMVAFLSAALYALDGVDRHSYEFPSILFYIACISLLFTKIGVFQEAAYYAKKNHLLKKYFLLYFPTDLVVTAALLFYCAL